jgi:hypothetical protein
MFLRRGATVDYESWDPLPTRYFKKFRYSVDFSYLKDLRLWLVFLGEGFLEVFLVGQLQLFPVLEEILRLHL